MLSREEKYKANQRIKELKKNPPKPTHDDHVAAERLLNKWQKFEEDKEKDCRRELKDACYEAAGDVDRLVTRGAVSTVVHGIGEGKKVNCDVCQEHDSQMFFKKDNKWYCAEHRWFGDLTDEQKEKERICLSTKGAKQ